MKQLFLISYNNLNDITHMSEGQNLRVRLAPAIVAIKFPCVSITPFPKKEKKEERD